MVDITNLTTATTAGDLIEFANESSQGYLAIGFIIAFFFITLLISKRFEFSNALLTAGFLSFMVSAVMAFAGWIPLILSLVFLIITAFTYFYMVVSET